MIKAAGRTGLGLLRAACSCLDDCGCTCVGCLCDNWGEEEPF